MPKHQSRKTGPGHLDGDGGSDSVIQGTAAIYLFEPNGDALPFLGDYEVDMILESSPEQLRAYRKRTKREGKLVPKLPQNSLRDHVLIAFGPQVSAQQAIAAMERAIESIKNTGLLIGRDPKGNLVWEHDNGEVTVF